MFNIAESFPCDMDTREAAKKETLIRLIMYMLQFISVNPLSPDILLQILQTDLHTFPYRMS